MKVMAIPNAVSSMFMCVVLSLTLIFNSSLSETEGFKIDTMGTYHGMTLKSVTVRRQ